MANQDFNREYFTGSNGYEYCVVHQEAGQRLWGCKIEGKWKRLTGTPPVYLTPVRKDYAK